MKDVEHERYSQHIGNEVKHNDILFPLYPATLPPVLEGLVGSRRPAPNDPDYSKLQEEAMFALRKQGSRWCSISVNLLSRKERRGYNIPPEMFWGLGLKPSMKKL
jgi:hypothetical protein